jgi:hypothetical protein
VGVFVDVDAAFVGRWGWGWCWRVFDAADDWGGLLGRSRIWGEVVLLSAVGCRDETESEDELLLFVELDCWDHTGGLDELGKAVDAGSWLEDTKALVRLAFIDELGC